MLRFARRFALVLLLAAAPLLFRGEARAEGADMFDDGVAKAAFLAIANTIGHAFRVVGLEITPKKLTLTIANETTPGEVEVWSVSHEGLFGATGVDIARNEGSERASLPGGGLIADNVAAIGAEDVALVPKIAAAAIARARLQQGGHVASMALMRLPKFIAPKARDPYWQIHVVGVEEDADISASLAGAIRTADLNRTRRAASLDLLAGGADLDEMLQTIRDQIKNDWIFHYIEIGKTGVEFDVRLASVKDSRITRFGATLNGVMTSAVAMPHHIFPGEPEDDPFALADVDFSILPKMESVAKERLGIADGEVQRAIVSRPHRENASSLEWRIDVRSASAPLFHMPNDPPVMEGAVFFDVHGNVLRANYPPGLGPKVDLFAPDQFGKALAKIAERLGAHRLVNEVLVTGDRIEVKAQDADNPGKLVVFVYAEGDVARAPDGVQTVANAMPTGAGALWDLALLSPKVAQAIGGMESQTLARLHMPKGVLDRITISKDKLFHPENDKVLIEIRAAENGGETQWVTFGLDGAPAQLAPIKSGVFVGDSNGKLRPAPVMQAAPVGGRDRDACAHEKDAAAIIAACTRLIQNPALSDSDRAIAFFNRGYAHTNRKEFDLSVADNNEAIRLSPDYAAAYMNRGFAYAAKGDAANALPDYNKAIELNPQMAIAYLNRGILENGQKNDDAAIADYTRVVEIEPTTMNGANAYANRGLTYARQRKFAEAAADYTRYLAINPNDALIYQIRGAAYAGMGDNDKASADYAEALKRGGPNPNLLNARAEFNFRAGRLEAALADYDQALSLKSDFAPALLGRAAVRRQKLDFDGAVADASAAIRLDANLPEAYANRGFTYAMQGDSDHSAADYTRTLEINPKWAAGYFSRGSVWFAAGQTPKALADFSQAAALAPAGAYNALLLDIVSRKSNLPGRLAGLAPALDMTAWPAPVLRLYLGQSTVEATLAAADSPNAQTKINQTCEANFYAGELALLNAKRDDAKSLIARAAQDCPRTFWEWQYANAELKALDAPAP